ncbi:MAG: hypothetical protein OQK32_06720 [Gammaproteobacteria bacterium]|nr:hypothetical protein [Gammaproteobacteria bacterium]MCW8923993.1 hypothetical protein [Gammaproteobacteria bacterium]
MITLLWVSCFYTSNTLAKDYFPLITYQCDTAKDILLVTNTLLKDGKEKDFKYSDADGTYSPWDMVTLKNNTITDTSSIKKECKLSGATYTVILEPQIFNYDLTGQCGANISTAITILSNNTEIQERKPFEFYCTGNIKIITGIKVIGNTGEIKTRKTPRHKYY